MHMNVVFTDNTFKNANILAITDLNQQVTTTLLNITNQHGMTIFSSPNQMTGQTAYTMRLFTIINHSAKIAKFIQTKVAAINCRVLTPN